MHRTWAPPAEMRLSLLAALAAAVPGPAAVGPKRFNTLPPVPKDDIPRDGVFRVSFKAAARINIYNGTFQQLIDHDNPSLGTFTQRYWYNADFYTAPGSPVVLLAPTESSGELARGCVTNATLPGAFAQTNGGAAIVLEHRYFGTSSPYQDLTTQTLQYLTVDQAIRDVVRFARHVELPFDPSGSSRPDKAPWILTGCSYSGALAAWIARLAPGTFWAYHCSSAVVQAVGDFWQYFAPVEEAMPRNCSADVKRISAHLQRELTTRPEGARRRLKDSFGLGELQDDDFVFATMYPLGWWQQQQFYSGYGGLFQMCDWIEVSGFGGGRNASLSSPYSWSRFARC